MSMSPRIRKISLLIFNKKFDKIDIACYGWNKPKRKGISMKKNICYLLVCLQLMSNMVTTVYAAEKEIQGTEESLAVVAETEAFYSEAAEMVTEVIAEEAQGSAALSGVCGDNLKWVLENGVLTISGAGAMYDFKPVDKAPWHEYRTSIKSAVLENGVSSIGTYAFNSFDSNFYALETISLPDSLISIGENAFENCQALTHISIPESVTSIGDYAFGSSGLVSIEIPGSIVSIESTFGFCRNLTSVTLHEGLVEIGGTAFYGCEQLSSITIPDSVKIIGERAFSLTNLKSIVIPGNVKSLGKSLFDRCYNLESVSISASVEDIGAGIFTSCPKLTNLTVHGENQHYSAEDNILFNKDKTELIFCSNGKSGEYTIPASVTCIAEEAFRDCKNITGITIPEGVVHIGERAFQHCDSMTSIVIPDSATDIGIYAFGYSGITNVAIPKSWTAIPEGAFASCDNLTAITIPDNITAIGDSAFQYTGLKSIYIPETVTSIGASAFNRTYLSSVSIPGSVVLLNDNVFKKCNELKTVYFKGNAPQFIEDDLMEPGCFYGTTTTVYYPANNLTWTADVMHDHGGSITWIPYVPDCSNGHTEEVLAGKEATCTESGLTVGKKCSVCGAVTDEQEVIPAKGHAYDDDKDLACNVCGAERQEKVETNVMHRLYNPNSGEHFYTGSEEERDVLVSLGWIYEGIAWNAPTKTGDSVYRLYNPNSGDHHYTMSAEERDMLVGVGWQYEGVCWNSASAENLPLYRLYNPNADCGSHHYTGSEEERDHLVSLGWIYEGIGWFGMVN